MRINTQRGIAPIVIIIIALLIVGGGGYAIKKGLEKRAGKERGAAKTEVPVSAANTVATEQTAAVVEAVQKEVTVTYTAQGFSPKSVTIKKGNAVVFENKTGKRMSVASSVHPTHLLYPEFDQYKTDQRGKDEFRFSFEKIGTWKYHDHLNSTMTGTVIVTE